tara:strand:- start:153 stop:1202 length:1050 start_codon:yes stop_codon:yes gene_type:complete
MNNYSYLDKVLHRQFLGSNPLSYFLHKQFYLKNTKYNLGHKNEHVFVTGLARSGTTALLNKIFSSKEIPSLTYKQMPFILSPQISNLIVKFSRDKNNESFDRYHNDGIKIDINSPECLDEPFWIKSFEDSVNKNYISLKEVPEETLSAYSNFLYQHAAYQNSSRILIKNNNNHLRLISLSKYFSNSKFFVMIREPLSQARSLLNQHKNFIRIQKKDPFVLEYMNIIGHYEFGLNSKAFIYNYGESRWDEDFDKSLIDYWLTQWIKTYEWILKSNLLNKSNIFSIVYEELCDDKFIYKKICDLIKVKNFETGTDLICSNKSFNENVLHLNKSKLNYSRDIYQEIKKKSLS